MVFIGFIFEMVFFTYIISENNCSSANTPSEKEPTNILARMLSPRYLSSFGNVSSMRSTPDKRFFNKVFLQHFYHAKLNYYFITPIVQLQFGHKIDF